LRLSIRRALLLAFVAIVLFLATVLLVMAVVQRARIVRDLSAPILERTQLTVDAELRALVAPIRARLMAHCHQIRAGLQVWVNLVVNARDAMPRGGDLFIGVDRATAGPDGEAPEREAAVVLSVRDTGSGMSAEVQSRIFEPFLTTKGSGRGTGLGLATCHGIVQQAGGAIRVDSAPGAGTTFRSHLPAVDAEPDAGFAGPRAGLPRGRETVLVAEGEPRIAVLIERVLAGCGYRVFAAQNGDGALRLSAELDEAIDFLVSDVVMPGLSGRQLAAKLGRDRPGLEVLFVSGYSAEATSRRIPPGTSFLAKPFSPEALAH
jgi:CheY-like chemotaxis protein